MLSDLEKSCSIIKQNIYFVMSTTETEEDEENMATLKFSLVWKLGQYSTTDSFYKISVSRPLTLRRLMSYIYGAPILDVSRSHTTTQHSR